jgi:protein phosphatase
MTRLNWRVAAITDRGLIRPENQDSFFVSADERVFVVADGMGGQKGGAIASRLAVEAVEMLWKKEPPPAEDRAGIHRWLVEAVSEANRTVYLTASDDPALHKMGTTIIVGIQSDDGFMHIAHVGDSRAYLIRDGKTIVLTQDHTIIMEMLIKGHLTPDQLKTSPFRHYLTRCVGHKSKVEIDETPVELLPGDWIIMSTDGLSSVLHDEEIGELVERCREPGEVCDALLEETLVRGAPDNITITAINYVAAPVTVY